jgi:hypothetical protein
MLVMPLSPLLDVQAQQATMNWLQDKPNRQLWLGPDTALLDQHGRWLAQKDRPLWSWLGVEPGPLVDLKEEVEIEGERHRRFRILELTGKAEVLIPGKWRARAIPGQIKCGTGAFMHAYDWTASFGASQGSQAIPT